MEHELKILPTYASMHLRGVKPWELRKKNKYYKHGGINNELYKLLIIKLKKMTRKELEKEVSLILEQFDENRNADMRIFLDGIVDVANAYIKIQLINSRKKVIVDYLEKALVNERQRTV